MEIIISFANVSSAIAAEQILSGEGITALVMPTPSAIQKGCGFCLRLPPQSLAAAIECLEKSGVQYSGVFSRDPKNGGSVYAPFDARPAEGGV
jgi:hypothetical protein